MAQSASANCPRAGFGLAALARVAGDGKNFFERNRVSYPHGSAAAGLSPDQARGSSPDSASALAQQRRDWLLTLPGIPPDINQNHPTTRFSRAPIVRFF